MLTEVVTLVNNFGFGIVAIGMVIVYAILTYRSTSKQAERQTEALEAASVRQALIFEESTKQQNVVLQKVADSNVKVADTLSVIRELLADKFGYLEGKLVTQHMESVLLLKNHCADVVRIEAKMSEIASHTLKTEERTKRCMDSRDERK